MTDDVKNIYTLLVKAEAILFIIQDYLKTDPKKIEMGKNILLKSIDDFFKEVKELGDKK